MNLTSRLARFGLVIALLLANLARVQTNVRAGFKDTWLSVHSHNFSLLGNASDREIREVAENLERFREGFSHLFPKAPLGSPVPTKVIVLKSDSAFRPYKPIYNGKPTSASGYFQPGPDINYVALTSEKREEYPYATIFHEYVHSLTGDYTRELPTWFSEGLAEFYSTFVVTGDNRRMTIGSPISSHVLLLRESRFLPLRELFAVSQDSADYNEKSRQSIFYAESWALIHYLMMGNEHKRQPQLTQFIQLLAQHAPVDESFRQAFQTDYATLEKELQKYILRDSYTVQFLTFAQALDFSRETTTAPVSEAEADATLGDLMLHMDRLPEAEALLKKAIELDPKRPGAHASLGMVLYNEKNYEQARLQLERAVQVDPQNHLAHYNYAYARFYANGASGNLAAPDDETFKLVRDELKQAIALGPKYSDSYNLLATVDLVKNVDLPDATTASLTAISLAPGRQDYPFILAQIYVRRNQYEAARNILKPLMGPSVDSELRTQAEKLIAQIDQFEKIKAENDEALQAYTRQKALADSYNNANVNGGSKENEPPDPSKPCVSFAGENVRGMLKAITCDGKSVSFTLDVDGKQVVLAAKSVASLKFITCGSAGGEHLTCGALSQPRPVVIFYQPAAEGAPAGEVTGVVFLKPQS